MKYLITILISLVLGLASYIFIYIADPLDLKKETIENELFDKIPQSEETRLIKRSLISENADDYNFEFYNPTLQASSRKHIYIYDHGRFELIKFNLEMEVIDRISFDEGAGPYDIVMPGELQYYNGELYLLDINNAKMIILDETLSLKNEIHFQNFVINTLAVVPHHDFFWGMLQNYDENGVFISFNNDGLRMFKFDPLRDDTESDIAPNVVQYTGHLATTDEVMVYSGIFEDVLRIFHFNGDELPHEPPITRALIDPLEDASELQRNQVTAEDGSTYYMESRSNDVVAAADIEILDDAIVMLFSGEERLRGSHIDIYELEDGTYRKSLKLEDFSAHSLLPTERGLFLLNYHDQKFKLIDSDTVNL